MKKLIAAAILGTAFSFAGAQVVHVQNTNITTDTTWGDDEDQVVLEGTIYVNNGATLTILADTIVRGQPRTASAVPGSLVITADGMINAQGQAQAPIIFTTAAVDNTTGRGGSATPGADGIPDDDDDDGFMDAWTPADGAAAFYDADPKGSPLGVSAAGDIPNNLPGDGNPGADSNVTLWGGLVVLGNAPTNVGLNQGASGSNAAKTDNIEGLTFSADTLYGGDIANDNSGIMRYLSVRHGGDEIGTGNEINGITLGGVGSGTTLEYCEVYCNLDDGFEFFGGTVNTNHLAVFFAGDDQFDGDQGWIGQNQFWFAVLPYFAIGNNSGDEAFEFDGQDGNPNIDANLVPTPLSNYAVYNATTIGADGAGANKSLPGSNGTIDLKADFSGQIVSSIITYTGSNAPVKETDLSTVVAPTIDACTFYQVGAASALITGGTDNFTAGFAGFNGSDASQVAGLNPRPVPTFPNAPLTNDIVEPAGLEQVSYRGAFDSSATTLWTTDWTALNVLGILAD